MQLNFQIFGEEGQPLIIVHGLFGSIANWRAVARELSQQYQVFVVDQRNHGDSPHVNSMSYVDMAADLDEFVCTHDITDFILCGHSMGGKAAMAYALSEYESLKKMHSLIILDIAPDVYTHSHAPYLQAMSEVDLNVIGSRAEVEVILKEAIPDSATRLFLMQSLERKNAQFRWKINVPILRDFMSDIVGFPNEYFLQSSNQVNTLFLHGSHSDYVLPNMHKKIQAFFPNFTLDTIAAGHWLHVEQRDAMLASIRRFLNSDRMQN